MKKERRGKKKIRNVLDPPLPLANVQTPVRDQNEFSTTFLTCTLMNNRFLKSPYSFDVDESSSIR